MSFLNIKVANFIKDNKNLINENSKESWEKIYDNYSLLKGRNHALISFLGIDDYKVKHFGELTETLLAANIDPADKMSCIPKGYLYESSIEKYAMPKNANYIGEAAFVKCKNLKEIEIPETIKIIERDAFMLCTNLQKVIICEGCEHIMQNAFWGCWELEYIEIPNTIVKMGNAIFYQCKNLKEINFKGTMHQWNILNLNSISSNGNWNRNDVKNRAISIICTDGIINIK